jgi:hypothetical protein
VIGVGGIAESEIDKQRTMAMFTRRANAIRPYSLPVVEDDLSWRIIDRSERKRLMADIVITGKVAEQLAKLAKQQNRPVEEILEGLLSVYQPVLTRKPISVSLHDFPVDDLGPWPEGLTLRREEMYGDDER